jgi:uncharacterized peroxidase-related enzyme
MKKTDYVSFHDRCREDTHAAAQPVPETSNAEMGFVPNVFKAIAANPIVLEAVMSLQYTLTRTLDVKTRSSIALAVSQTNGFDYYCLAAHTFVSAEMTGMTYGDIALGRIGSSTDPKRAAAAHFARELVNSYGKVSDTELAAVRDAGYSDPQIFAIVAVAVQYLMTNYLNNVIQTDIDLVESIDIDSGLIARHRDH